MSKIFDNIETNFEEGLHTIPESADRAGLLKVGVMSFKSPKKASELKVNCAGLKAA
jgi:hypothetical protein